MDTRHLSRSQIIRRYRIACASDREAARADWLVHWPSIVARGLFTFGGGALLGLLFGLSLSLLVLTEFLRNY